MKKSFVLAASLTCAVLASSVTYGARSSYDPAADAARAGTLRPIPVTSPGGLLADETFLSDIAAQGDKPGAWGISPAAVKAVEKGTGQIDWSSGKKGKK